MGAVAVPKLTVEEYLAADRVAEVRSEYHDGEVFPMVGATWQHGAIIVNVSAGLHASLKGTECRALAASARLRARSTRFFYPDLMVVCGQMAFADEREDTITNPKIVVEILSPASQDYDYGTKFASYRWLPSLEEYVLVSQVSVII